MIVFVVCLFFTSLFKEKVNRFKNIYESTNLNCKKNVVFNLSMFYVKMIHFTSVFQFAA